MSYSSKRTIGSMMVAILLVTAYTVHALGGTAPAPDDLRSWAVTMLVFIGIGIAAVIVMQILFHILFAVSIAVKEKENDEKQVKRIIHSVVVEDERDKIIGLKSAFVGYICAGTGFVASLLALVLGLPVLYALHIVFGSFFIGSILEGGVRVYHYERGVRNG